MSVAPGGRARPGSSGQHRWRVGDDRAGERVDRYVATSLSLSRNRVANLLAGGLVRVNGCVPRKSDPVVPGQIVEVTIPPPVSISVEAQAIDLDIVYEDGDLVVVNKQPGLVVHPAPGHRDGTLVNALLHHVGDLAGIGGELRPGIVHRLDRDTSGLMVVAKSDLAHRTLSDALRHRRIERRYLTALWGSLGESPLTVDHPIGRHPGHRLRMAVVAGGRPARTHFCHIERWPAASLCEVRLESGRTHQIRVHAAAIGHPVVGDELYGKARERGFGGAARQWARELSERTGRQFLHAYRLELVHPVTGRPLAFRAALPPDLAEVHDWARASAPVDRW